MCESKMLDLVKDQVAHDGQTQTLLPSVIIIGEQSNKMENNKFIEQ